MRDDVEKQWNEKPAEGEEQQPTSQKLSEGSPKQVPPLGVLLRFLTSQVGYLTRENYSQKYQMTGACELAKRLTKTRSQSSCR